MSNEDANLSNTLQKLDIEPESVKKSLADSPNPFMRRKRSKSLSSVNIFGSSCSCPKKQLRLRNTTSFKRTPPVRKVLREPVLKFIQCSKCSDRRNPNETKCERTGDVVKNIFGHSSEKDQDFKSIVAACEQLSLANANDGVQDYSLPVFREVRSTQRSDSQKAESSSINSSCSHQARMSAAPPCDVTIDELASYFETFVHIPKKMSSMAEMMYI